jgi:hypothetical protein
VAYLCNPPAKPSSFDQDYGDRVSVVRILWLPTKINSSTYFAVPSNKCRRVTILIEKSSSCDDRCDLFQCWLTHADFPVKETREVCHKSTTPLESPHDRIEVVFRIRLERIIDQLIELQIVVACRTGKVDHALRQKIVPPAVAIDRPDGVHDLPIHELALGNAPLEAAYVWLAKRQGEEMPKVFLAALL